ncbi:MAG: type V CRISPR-associated protein Cas12a/Cpf1 [Bacteroidia bacterium]|nr:type V CRISPR-associated protein Cas12a/Cpf1 [Bacteroidia bacterium]
METNFFKSFTKQYSLSKTLRFELKPVGKTLANIETKGLLKQDSQRAASYKEMKKTIDKYHKDFIELALKNVRLTKLEGYCELYSKSKEDRDEAAYKKVKEDLRKEIVRAFSSGEAKEKYKNLFAKELIKEDLETWIKQQENRDELYFDERFKNFTTYFTGFHENRKNIYSDEEKSTAIAYRIIHENLPKFIENIKLYQSIKEKHHDLDFSPILTEMEEVIQGKSLDEIFSLEYFNNVLSQNGIEFINFIIGGKTPEVGDKIRGLNEYINLYNQQQKEKNKRAPKFKQLYKQILSDRTSISLRFEAFENDSELLEAIEVFYQNELCEFETEGKQKNVFGEIKTLCETIPAYDTEKVYLRNDTGLTNISQRIFGTYSVFRDAISFYYDTVIDPAFQSKYAKAKTDSQVKKLTDTKNKWNHDFISIGLLQKALYKYIETLDADHEIRKAYTATAITDYFKRHTLKQEVDEKRNNETIKKIIDVELFYAITGQYLGVKGLLNIEKTDHKALAQDKEKVHQLKSFLDSIMELNHFVKPLVLSDDSISDKDDAFYSQFAPLYEQLNKFIPLYNMVRNYLTQKPYSTEKIKLNFENSTLLDGWDVNKEPDNTSVILRKDGLYYLAVMDKANNKVFQKAPKTDKPEASYEKMNYKLLPGANKMLPKVFFADSRIKYFKPSGEILENYKNDTHKKGETFNINDCHALIDFFKASLDKHEDWKHFNFKFSPTDSYKDLSGFYREVEHQGYKITFEKIPSAYIDNSVEDGKIYLFQIYNKDFSQFSKGKSNMHTMYWKALFDNKNLADVVYKLNGQAEVFFRKSSIEEKNKKVHKAHEPLKSKNPLTPNNKNTFEYDLIKDRRYTVDKFQFHVPITMNFKATGSEVINAQTNEFLENNPDVKIIGLDRGERHLIYLTLIDQQGNIIIQESLNTISNKERNIETAYHTLLHEKEKERDAARKSWNTIESIKELKEGYLSQVVHKIAEMMVKYNAIVVMEDLNFGFKRGRFKVEKQVYQKLEKMLIDKLNYLVFKNAEPTQTGGLFNALQLTNKFESFQKMGKQSGFLYYVPAAYTSKIDPTTGFIDFLKPKYENVEKAKDFFSKFDSIKYNTEKDYFEFAFDYKNFTAKVEGLKTDWFVCTHGDTRYRYNPQTKASEAVNVTQEMKTLFEKHNINYKDGKDLKNDVIQKEGKEIFSTLLHLMAMTLSLRHTKSGTEIDFILSPVANEKGEFYDSRTANKTLPQNADANGAYHIALKGLWCLQQINKADDMKKINLSISNKEWLEFVQNKK